VVLYIDIETRDLAMSKIKKVLIIEDNDCLLRLMDHYFGKRYTVFPTRNGLDAMRYLNDEKDLRLVAFLKIFLS